VDEAATVACHHTAGIVGGRGSEIFRPHFIHADGSIYSSRADHAAHPFRSTPHSFTDRLKHAQRR